MKKAILSFFSILVFVAAYAVADTCVNKRYVLTFIGMGVDAQGTPVFQYQVSIQKKYSTGNCVYNADPIEFAIAVSTPSVAAVKTAVANALPTATATPIVVNVTPTPSE